MRQYRAFTYTPHHHTWIVFSIINMPHQNRWTYLLMLDNLLKSMVFVRVHSWCDTFYEFGQTYCLHSLLLFTALNFFSVLPIDSCPPPQSLVTTDSFTFCHFVFSMHYSLNPTVYSLFRLVSFIWQHAFNTPPCLFMAW